MSPTPLSSDLVGMTTEPSPVAWDSKDAMLYACGVGAKPDRELDFLFARQQGRVVGLVPAYNHCASCRGAPNALVQHRIARWD